MIARLAAEMIAPPNPCTARAPSSTPGEPAIAQTSEASEKSAVPAEEDPAAAEQVRGPPAEQQEARERERVRVDDPLRPRRREAQAVPDRGQRHVHDRDVEDDHELREADQEQEGVRIPPDVGPGRVDRVHRRSESRM